MTLKRLVIFISLMVSLCVSAKVRMLSVCIGEYPAESGWNALGADNDAVLIREHFPDARIISNESATSKRILSELASLTRSVSTGDTVIVHFSGHGQQIISDKSPDEVDLVDEALVAYDASRRKSATYNGQAHITDDVFGEQIVRLRNAVGHNGLVIAVVDACHSDSMDKDAAGSTGVYRGTDEIFGAETLSPDSIARLRDLYDSPDESVVLTSPELSDVIFMSACATHQRNYEIKVGDTHYGSLTYYFCKTLREKGIADLNGFLSDLYCGMTSDRAMRFHGQTPVIRNTLGWEAPMSKVFEPTDPRPVCKEDDSHADRWWYALGVFVVITLILMLCRKRD